jgi:hypothetical protein
MPGRAQVHRRGPGPRRYRRAVTALAVVSILVAGGAVVRMLPLGARGTPPAGKVIVVSSSSAAAAAGSVQPTRSGAQPGAEPLVLLGGIGGDSERTAVISVATGKVLRYLSPPPGGQALGVLSPDRRIWFEPAGDGPCGSTWRAIVVRSGAIVPALGGERGIETLALGPDGHRLALVKARPAGSGCGHRLVVRDLATGHERSWPLDPATRLGQLSWSPDGDLLAYELSSDGDAARSRHQLLVVRVATMRAAGDGLALKAPDPGCMVSLPRFRAGSGRLVAAEHCADADRNLSQGRALLEYDPASGALGRTLVRLPGNAMITDLSVDASGRHLLVLLFPRSSSQATAYVLRQGSLRKVLRGVFTASW